MNIGTVGSRRSGPTGFTLVEIIIAVAIFSIVMTALFSILISQQKSIAVTREQARVQDRLQSGLRIMGRELKEAGSGLPLGISVRIPSGWDRGFGSSIVCGLEVVDGGPGRSDTLVVARALSPPVLLTRKMDTTASPLEVEAGARWGVGMLGIISDGTDAEIFRVTRVDRGTVLQHGGATGTRSDLSKRYPRGASVTRILLAGYAVDTPRKSNASSLVLREIDRNGIVRDRPIANGVFDLQLRLLMPDGSERDAGREESDRSAGLSHAVGVRIRLAARGRLAGDPRPQRMGAVVGFRNRGEGL